MSNEATVNASLSIESTELKHRGYPQQFRATVTGRLGPGPGAIIVTPSGVDVDLSEFTNPSLYEVRNLDLTNLITIGIWDGTEFYPLNEVLAGEHYVGRLSRYLGTSIESGSGTGTYDTGTYTLRLKSDYTNVNAYFGAFEL